MQEYFYFMPGDEHIRNFIFNLNPILYWVIDPIEILLMSISAGKYIGSCLYRVAAVSRIKYNFGLDRVTERGVPCNCIRTTSLHTAIIRMTCIAAFYGGVLTWNRKKRKYIRLIV